MSESSTSFLSRPAISYQPTLDVVRFLAAFWVMLSHAHAVEGGGHAVAVFFVLSGYLIGGQLIAEKWQTNTIQLSEFYFKRVTRIWLPYFLVLGFYLCLFFARGQNAFPGFYERMFGAITYTYNLVNQVMGSIHPTWVSANQIWSLSIEEQFYLVAPILVVFTPRIAIVPLILILTAISLIWQPLYGGLPIGMLLAAIVKFMENRWKSSYSPLRMLAFLIACSLLFLIGQKDIWKPSWLPYLRQESCVTYLLSAIVVLLAVYIPLPKSFHKGLRTLGLMTYSYYLIHVLPGYFLSSVYRRIIHEDEIPVWFGIFCGLLALPLSYLFVRWIELPTLRFRNSMLKIKSPWVQAAPWLAWGLNIIGAIGVIYIAIRSRF